MVFLEEDHYVAEDFLHVLKLMRKQAPDMCPMCKAFGLGPHLDLDVFENSRVDRVSDSKHKQSQQLTILLPSGRCKCMES